MDRSMLRGRTRVAQGVALVGIACAGALAALGLPGAWTLSRDDLSTEPAPPPGPSAAAPGEAEVVVLPEVEVEGIAVRLSMLENAPTPADPPPTTEQDEPEVVPEQPGGTDLVEAVAPSRKMRYLGGIIEPSRRIALIVIDGKQRIVPEGGEAGGVQVREVASDHVIVEIEGVESRLDLAPRAGPRVTRVDGADFGMDPGMPMREPVRRPTRGGERE